MNYPNFCGQSYVSSSPAVDSERSMNVFPEVINGPGIDAKSKLVLRRRPGLALLQTLNDSPCRGLYAINGRAFAVAGGSFYELTGPTTAVLRGSFVAGSAPVQFASNTVQILFIADGAGYLFNLATNVFSQVKDQPGFPSPAVSITSIDTYFLALGANKNTFALSEPLDGSTWKGINFGSSQEPDNAVAIAQLHLNLWIFGQNETILFQDSGNSSFPFTRIPGSQIEQGCAAVGSVALLDNTLFWLGSDPRGPGVVYRADGLLPTRVSTHAVESAMQGYSRLDDAIASTYQADGHLFYLLHFPTAGATWAYDLSTGMWHERGAWSVVTGSYAADLARFHCFAFGKHLVGDYSSGKIYELSTAYATDAGAPLRWLRAAPHLSNEDHWLFYSYFQLDMETGGGLPGGGDPVVMLRWSDDGGFTWSTPRQVSCGKVGEYARRVRVNRCGRSRNRVFEVSGTDGIPRLALINAYLGVTAGVN